MELNFNSSREAWESINEMFISVKSPIIYNGGGFYLYNLTINIENPRLDFNAPLGRYFNYSKSKWIQLLGNYLDKEKLNSLKQNIASLNGKKYNLSYTFNNSHSHGKNCLLSAVFTKSGKFKPHITFFLRASEITKRLLVDLIFFQRIGEYVYGDTEFTISIHIVQVFQDSIVILMYSVHKRIKPFIDKENPYSLKIWENYKKLKHVDPQDIKYKVHLRALKVLRPKLYKYPEFSMEDCTF